MTRAELLKVSLLAVAALLAAVPAQWGLQRLGRRLPRMLARRAGRPIAPGVALPWEGTIQIGVVALTAALWLVVGLYASNQFAPLRRAREMFMQMVVTDVTAPMFTLSGRSYSALDLLKLPAVLAAVWIAIGAFTRVLKAHILRATRLERGVQDAVALLTRYTLAFLGGIVVLQLWGIDASSLTFVASVLGVGIGFGLQHLANNFVSGLVISLQRPIQPGDFVNVGEWSGTVERIGPRHTEIRTLDNISILVPNSRFLETEVVNWTHGDPVSRLHVPVGVAYGSDIAQVRAALLAAARSHPDVLGDPRPRVELRGFGDSALQFELLVWTRDPRLQLRLTSELNYRIAASLRAHDIQIPFPQRDLHLRSPQLDQLLNAWSRRVFTAAELSGSNGQGAFAAPPPMTLEPFEDESGPWQWSAEQLQTVIGRMRSPEGLAIADRRHLLARYPQCFVGREAVDWMTRVLGLSRREAVELGQLLVDRGIVHHVLDEHGFVDGNLFYRFRADEASPAAGPSIHA
jgi:small-conductance mechanosensitive channel